MLGVRSSVGPKPADEANRCILGHVAPKAIQKALYVGFIESGRPLQAVYFGWSQFPFPEARLAGLAGPIYSLTEGLLRFMMRGLEIGPYAKTT